MKPFLLLLLSVAYCSADVFEIEEYCENLESAEQNSNVFRHYPYPNPSTLSIQGLRAGIEERKELLLDYIESDSTFWTLDVVPALILRNVSFEFEVLVRPYLVCLEHLQDPDFFIMPLIRILYLTDEYTDDILPVLKQIPYWLTSGESLRIYWSENHIIMYSVNAYLLRQKFGTDGFQFDEGLDERLNWFLTSKPETGFFEFNSQLYGKLTLGALVLLHDLTNDLQIKELAYNCIQTFFKESMIFTNSYGVNLNVAGRVYHSYYLQCDNPSSSCQMYGHGVQEIVGLATGMGPLIVEGEINSGTIFLAMSSIDIAPVISTYTEQLSVTQQVGLSRRSLLKSIENLTRVDQIVIMMSMGGYAHEDYIQDLFELVEIYDMWDHSNFIDFAGLRAMPSSFLPFLSSIISSRTKGSLLFADNLKVFKNEQVILSSLNGYFSGFKTYQQFPWVIGIGNVSAFVQAMPLEAFNSSLGKSQTASNDQTPFLNQKDNVILAVYNPNLDLSLIGTDPYSVVFFMEIDKLDEVVDSYPQKWLFGRLGEGYVAIYRHCLEQNSGLVHCTDKQQLWMGVVGNNNTHGDFESFMQGVVQAEVVSTKSFRCVTVKANVDGQVFDEQFCNAFGNANIFVIIMMLCFMFCCFWRCLKAFFISNFSILKLKEKKRSDSILNSV